MSKKKATANKATEHVLGDEDMEALASRLESLEATVARLTNIIIGDAKPPPSKRVKVTLLDNDEIALRARVGRAAKRAGIPYKEFVRRYGMVDRWPLPDNGQERLPLDED